MTTKSATCPFCPHPRHDDRECRAVSGGTFGFCECVGPNEQERQSHDGPEEVMEWVRDTLEGDSYGSKVTDVARYVGPGEDFIELTTKWGQFRLRLERAP